MSTTQRLIKYLAIAFAISLIVTIVASVLAGFGVLSFVFSLDDEEDFIQDVLTELNTTELTPVLDIDVAATELEIKIGEEFKIETNNKDVSCVQDGIKTKIVEKSHFRYSGKIPKLTI